jgi:hypothetical protein
LVALVLLPVAFGIPKINIPIRIRKYIVLAAGGPLLGFG